MKLPFFHKNPKQADLVYLSFPEPNEGNENITASDLPIALYLNQRLTFDLLAMLENGLSYLRHVEISSASEHSSEVSGSGEIGLSNAFALLGVKFGANGTRLRAKHTMRMRLWNLSIHRLHCLRG